MCVYKPLLLVSILYKCIENDLHFQANTEEKYQVVCFRMQKHFPQTNIFKKISCFNWKILIRIKTDGNLESDFCNSKMMQIFVST